MNSELVRTGESSAFHGMKTFSSTALSLSLFVILSSGIDTIAPLTSDPICSYQKTSTWLNIYKWKV